MTGSAKRKGDRAEFEVQGLLRELLGVPARRQLGAGRKDDIGDISGVPNTVIQVVDYADKTRALREKPLECERQRQQLNASELGELKDLGFKMLPEPFAATFIRLRGGDYRVVLTPEQWAAYWREAVG